MSALEERMSVAIAGFWKRVGAPDENGCWPWLGSIHKVNGYGMSPNKLLGGSYAHHYAYQIANGPVPEGLELDHVCRNRGCVNPDHLEAVTHSENVRRGISPAAKRAAQTHCKRGHEFTEANTYVDKNGWRACRTCHRIKQSERYHRLHSARAHGRKGYRK